MPDDKDKPDPALDPIVLSEEGTGGEDPPEPEGDKTPEAKEDPALIAKGASPSNADVLSDEEWYQKDEPKETPEYTSLERKSPFVRLISIVLAVALALVAFYLYRRSTQPTTAESAPLYQVENTQSQTPGTTPETASPPAGDVYQGVEEKSQNNSETLSNGATSPQGEEANALNTSFGTGAFSFSPTQNPEANPESANEAILTASEEAALLEGFEGSETVLPEDVEGLEGAALAASSIVESPSESSSQSPSANADGTQARPGPRVIPQNNQAQAANAPSAGSESESLTALSGGNIIAQSAETLPSSTISQADASDALLDAPMDPALDSEAAAPEEAPSGPTVTSAQTESSSSTVSPTSPRDPSVVRGNPQTPSAGSDTVTSDPTQGVDTPAKGPEVTDSKAASGSKPASQTVGPPEAKGKPAVTGSPASSAPSKTAAPAAAPAAAAAKAGADSADSKTSANKDQDENAISDVWVVSMFSSASEDEARSVFQKLQSFKPEGTLYLAKFTDKAGNLIHRVRLGFFKEKAKADSVAKDLAEKAKTPSDHWSSNPTVSEVSEIGAPVVGEGKK
ncbi:MAG: SPOR domain-containing protein [Deltaproteobacteria bacterium]|jgi:hypothetical protein|nr:SPOR domain-containing protein [Deltaproteobacteria bacterium]